MVCIFYVVKGGVIVIREWSMYYVVESTVDRRYYGKLMTVEKEFLIISERGRSDVMNRSSKTKMVVMDVIITGVWVLIQH